MEKKEEKSTTKGATPFAQTYFHGTKADLKVGDLIEIGYYSNYGQRKNYGGIKFGQGRKKKSS